MPEASDPEIGGLQSTLPSESSNHSSSSFYESQSCCKKFWGPFRAGGHTLREAGGSILLPRLFFLLWRIIAFVYLLASFIYLCVIHALAFQFLTVWSYLGLTLSFLLLVIASYRHLTQKSCYVDETRIFARWAVFFFQIFATAALLIDVIFWAVLFDAKEGVTFGMITTHSVNLVIVLIDMFVGLNMQFRLWNCLAAFCYFLTYYAFMWVRFAITKNWVYQIFDYNKNEAGKVALYHGLMLVGAIVAPFIMFFLNRLNRLVRKDPRARRYQGQRAK